MGELTAELGLSRPGTSKHLKVLCDAGLVTVRADAQRRWYELGPAPLAEVDEWLAPYRLRWELRAGTGHGPRLLLTHEGGGSDPSAVGAELRGFLDRFGA